MCDTRERDQAMKDGGLSWGTKGLEIDSMNVMMTQLGFSNQGRLDDAATQNRPGGDHKSMRK